VRAFFFFSPTVCRADEDDAPCCGWVLQHGGQEMAPEERDLSLGGVFVDSARRLPAGAFTLKGGEE
jgi:hypothetical protein